MKRRVESKTVKREVWVISRQSGEAPRSPRVCPDCAVPSDMLTPEEVAALVGVSPRTVYHWVEAGRVHFEEGAEGVIFVCLASLPHQAGSERGLGPGL